MKTDNKKILSLETSENICSVALGNEQVLLGEITLNKSHTHNERLAWMVDWLFKEQNISMTDIYQIKL